MATNEELLAIVQDLQQRVADLEAKKYRLEPIAPWNQQYGTSNMVLTGKYRQ